MIWSMQLLMRTWMANIHYLFPSFTEINNECEAEPVWWHGWHTGDWLCVLIVAGLILARYKYLYSLQIPVSCLGVCTCEMYLYLYTWYRREWRVNKIVLINIKITQILHWLLKGDWLRPMELHIEYFSQFRNNITLLDHLIVLITDTYLVPTWPVARPRFYEKKTWYKVQWYKVLLSPILLNTLWL